ncbi:MAG: lactate utilization protein [Thermodesulfobacteriota bacterium]
MTDMQYGIWLGEQTGHRTVENLKRHGFDAHFSTNVEEAKDLVLTLARKYETIGFGGSSTTRALNLPEQLKAQGKTIYDHWNPPPESSDLELRLKQGRCDCFIAGANAISVTGEIVNVDGVGNRTNAMTFGCPHVILVAGVNKLARDLQGALDRIRDVAGPMRAKSLNMATPCAETGFCTDCNSPQRICRITAILHRKPMMTDVTVILVNERLGF